MGYLESITTPRDLRGLDRRASWTTLASEIRDLLVGTCSRTGGHLGPNLGVVELTLAIHRVFDSPRDRVVFDTGHQAYVHKLLTGRAAEFDTLRQEGGLSGYPSQAESDARHRREHPRLHRAVVRRRPGQGLRLRGEDRHVVALIGDGALTGGMAWEALNNIADRQGPASWSSSSTTTGARTRPTVGGLANHLTSLRTNPRYEQILDLVKRRLNARPRRRPGGVRRAARDEEGHEGRARARRACSRTSA